MSVRVITVKISIDEYGTVRDEDGKLIGDMIPDEDNPDTYTLSFDVVV